MSFRKYLLEAPLVLAAVMLLGVAAYSQGARGSVTLDKGDGTKTPVVDALIESFRMDLGSGRGPNAKTDKRGQFVIALTPGRRYTLTVSAPGIAPAIARNIIAGQDGVDIIVFPGDGKQFSEEEARGSVKQGEELQPKNEEELKKAQAEYAAKVKEIEEKNKKAQQVTEIINTALKAGNDAFNSQNYEVAVAKYTEGIQADPEFVGSAPILYKNRGAAYTRHAVNSYNDGVKVADAAAKTEAHSKSRKAFEDAAESFLNGWNVLKNAPVTDITDPVRHETLKLETLSAAVETFRLAVFTEKISDRTLEIAKLLVPEYLALEKDAARKAQASVTMADLYRIREDRENAAAAYKKVLETSPDNVDALAYLGIVLVDMGWLKDNDNALMQEGANYLQKFVAVAPDSHKLKTGAVEYLEILKTQNVVPDKKAPTPRRRP